MAERRVSLRGVDIPRFAGVADAHLKLLREHFSGRISLRGEELYIRGPEEEVRLIERIILLLKERLRQEGALEDMDVLEVIYHVKGNGGSGQGDVILVTPKKTIRAQSPNQRAYVEAIQRNEIVVGIGPAGTGKTFLAVAMALKFLREQRVERIILTRPAVEAGESLGFLPGDFYEKINPYLVPLYDALYSMLPSDKVKRLIDTRVVEIAPLAYMRGRTFSDAFVILDEAQNTKPVQMKMFLTRLGPRSKVVITGDITQIDLPREESSGLVEIRKVLRGIPGIAFVHFGPEDVVRHPMVRRIIEAYERYHRESPREDSGEPEEPPAARD